MLYPVELWDRLCSVVRQWADEFKVACFDNFQGGTILRQMFTQRLTIGLKLLANRAENPALAKDQCVQTVRRLVAKLSA